MSLGVDQVASQRLRSLSRWDVVTAIVAMAYLIVAAVASPSFTALAVSVGVLVIVAAMYVWVGRPGFVGHQPRKVTAYLAVLIAGTAVALVASWAGDIALFVAYSHLWYFSDSWRKSIAWSLVLLAAVFACSWVAGDHLGASGRAVFPWVVGTALFSVPIGLWMNHISRVADERAELIAQLQAAESKLRESERAAGTLAERARLAQEIHDTLAQGFASTSLLSQNAIGMIDGGDRAAARTTLEQIRAVAKENLAEARAMTAAAEPADLQGSSVSEAIGVVSARFTAQTGVEIELSLAPCTCDADTSAALVRTVQEALTNVRRHAQADAVNIRLESTPTQIVLEITDNGIGMSSDSVEGIGLRGIRARAHGLGGYLLVGDADPQGTRLRLVLPARDTGELS